MQVSCGTFPPKTTWRRNWPRRPSQSWRRTSSSLCQAKTLMATSRRPLRQTFSTTPQDASGTPHLFVSSLCGCSMLLWLRCISSWLTWVWFPSHEHIFYMGTCSGSARQLTGSGLVELLPHPFIFTVVCESLRHSRPPALWLCLCACWRVFHLQTNFHFVNIWLG